MEFYEQIIVLHDDSHEMRSKFIFSVLNLDKDGILDIVNLVKIFRKLPKKCIFRFELMLLILEYKNKNVMKVVMGRRVEINFEVFNKLLPKISI